VEVESMGDDETLDLQSPKLNPEQMV